MTGISERIPDLPGVRQAAPKTRSLRLLHCFACCFRLRADAQPGEDAPGVAFEDLEFVFSGERKLIDVASGVVEVMPGFRIHAGHRSYHLRCEQDVADGNDLG